MSDQDELSRLLERVALRGPAAGPALAALYTLCAPRLRAVASRIVRRPELAEEVVHDAFIRIWDRAATFERLERRRRATSVAACLQRLPPYERQSLVLAHWHQMTHAELACHLSQPLGTIKGWVRRGMQRLRQSALAERVV